LDTRTVKRIVAARRALQRKTTKISIQFWPNVFNNSSMKSRIPRSVGFLIGILLVTSGTYLWYRNSESDEQKLAEITKKSRQVFDHYLNGDYVAAKQSVLDHILLLDKLSAGSANTSRNPYAADAISWFVRLSKLEKTEGGSASGDYMREARLRCEKLGRNDCSEETLSRDAARMDAIARSQLSGAPH
jgi:hypothetical protein